MTQQKPLILLDGSSYFYRAFHALPPLSTSRGEPTGAVYGVINMIRRLLKDYKTAHIGIVFDTKGKTFRDELYPEYKANREAMPDELSMQFEPMIEIIQAMGLPLLMVEGVEADDVIGTLARQAKHQGFDIVISTGDKDLAQLVNEHVTLINTMTNVQLDREAVIEKFGVPPELFIDYLTLIGDKVDNIPGVDKVGPKTAVKWLTQYGNLDSIIAHADEIKGKVGENLRTSLEQLPLSKTLVTIKCDVALSVELKDLTRQEEDREALLRLFKHLEFQGWIKELLSQEQEKQPIEHNYELILDEKNFSRWLENLNKADEFAFDTETTDLNYLNAELVGVSVATEENNAAYIPCAHDYVDAPQQLTRDFILSSLKPLLENPKKKKIGQNIKYDMGVLENYDIHVQGGLYDTMLESYVLNSGSNRHDMDSLALKYLGKQTIRFEDVAGKGKKQKTFNQVELKDALPYAAEDADITLQLHLSFWPKVCEEKGLRYVFEHIEMPLVPVLSMMERIGVFVDAKQLMQQSEELGKNIQRIEDEVFTLSGETFNINSPKQLQEVLFDKLNLPILQKTPTGQPSTSEFVLQELALDFPLPKRILEYRSLSKLKSTYTDRLPEQINQKTGRVHTSYNQAVAATGRLSSTDPNLQNIPVRTSEGRRIRQAFIAPPNYKIISSDYSQIELRIMAHLTNDPGLMEAFMNGFDIHTATAAEIFSVSIEQVTTEQRRNAKAINFGLIYGMSAFGLAKQLRIPREAAQEYIDCYFHRYPNVKGYMTETCDKAHEKGYVETYFGRRLYLPDINARNPQRQRAAERAAINAPMQGTAADIIKLAMINVHEWLQNTDIDARMIMQVHDELVFEVADPHVEKATDKIRDLMCNAVNLSVPLDVDIGVGDNWDAAH